MDSLLAFIFLVLVVLIGYGIYRLFSQSNRRPSLSGEEQELVERADELRTILNQVKILTEKDLTKFRHLANQEAVQQLEARHQQILSYLDKLDSLVNQLGRSEEAASELETFFETTRRFLRNL